MLSTTQSEYVAATYTAKEALWLCRLINLNKVFHSPIEPITLYSDSQSAIALTKDGSYHARTKHINIRYHLSVSLYEMEVSNYHTVLPKI